MEAPRATAPTVQPATVAPSRTGASRTLRKAPAVDRMTDLAKPKLDLTRLG